MKKNLPLILLCLTLFCFRLPASAETKSEEQSILIPISSLKVKPNETTSGNYHISRDNKIIVLQNDTGSYSMSFYIYDPTTFKRIDYFNFNGFYVLTDLDGNGRFIVKSQLARSGNPSKVLIYDIAKRKHKTFIGSHSEKERIDYKLSRDGKYLILAVTPFIGMESSPARMSLYNTETEQVIATFTGDSYDFSPDGATLTIENKVKDTHIIYSITNNKVLETFRQKDTVKFSLDGRYFSVELAGAGVLILYDAASGDKIKKFNGSSAYFSADNKFFTVEDKKEGTVSLFDMKKDQSVKTVNGGNSGFLAPLGLWYAVDAKSGTITVLDTATWEEKKKLKGSFAFAGEDGSLLAIEDKTTGTVTVYGNKSFEQVGSFKPDNAYFTRITARFGNGNRLFIVHTAGWKKVMFYDAQAWRLIDTLEYPESNSYSTNFHTNPNGKVLLVTGEKQPIRFYDLPTNSKIKEFDGKRIAVSPNWEKYAVENDKEHTTSIFNMKDMRKITTLNGMFAKFTGEGNTLLLNAYGSSKVDLYDLSKLQGVSDVELELEFKKGEFETAQEYEERLRALSYDYAFRVQLGKYDADNGGFTAELAGSEVFIRVPRARAKELSARMANLKVEGKLRFFDLKRVQLVDPVLVDGGSLEQFSVYKKVAGQLVAIAPPKPASYTPRPVQVEARQENIRDIPDFKATQRSSDLAVVIGIEKYRGVPSSAYSASDAGLMKDYLKALGFPERNIAFLADDKATLSDIRKTVESWLPNRVKRGVSRIFIYYSGHGAPEPATGDAYMVPFDGDPDYITVTGYSLKSLYERLGNLQAAEVVVVLDSCFSGAGGRSVLAKGARPLVMTTETTDIAPNIAIISASQGSQISASSPEKGHGVFTWHFLKALKDGKKSLAEIYDYLKPHVEDEAKSLNVQQTPSINPAFEKLKGKFNMR